MLHIMFVLALLFFAIFECSFLFFPKIFSALGNKKTFEKLQVYFTQKAQELERSQNKYAIAGLVIAFVGFALFAVIGSIGSIFFQLGLSVYALSTGLGSKLFALIVLGVSSYKLYGLTLGTKMAIEAKNHPTTCTCELCIEIKKGEEEAKKDFTPEHFAKEAEKFKGYQGGLLLREGPCVAYYFYILYLIW